MKKRSPEVLLSPINKIVKTIDQQSLVHDIGKNSKIAKQNVEKIHKTTSKKVYEGLNILTSKHLNLIEGKEQLKENLNMSILKKSKLQLEITEMEHKAMVLRLDSEKEKFESEQRQNKLKEQILESELKQNQIKEIILSKQLI